MRIISLFVIILFASLVLSCGSSKEVKETVKKQEIIKDSIKPTITQYEGNFDFIERYLIKNSSISLSKDEGDIIEDPIVGEFVKLKKGNKNTVILHKFKIDDISGEKISEIIFAFEINEIEINIKYYPEKFIYYFLSYDEEKSRIDGTTIKGYILFTRVDENYAIGNMDFRIEGVKKAFDKEDVEVEVIHRGTFRLPIKEFIDYGK